MRILLLHDALLPPSPVRVTTFLTQVVRHARDAGHDLRELVSHITDADKGLDRLRAVMRSRLDTEIANFDPQVVHVHGLGVLGHLALESGAPYVVSIFAQELLPVQRESTLHKQVQQALENAGCLIVDSDETRRTLETTFGEVQSVAIASESDQSQADEPLGWLWQVYREVVARRGLKP